VTENVRVCVRMRPLSDAERTFQGNDSAWHIDESRGVVLQFMPDAPSSTSGSGADGSSQSAVGSVRHAHMFTFDDSFDDTSSTEAIYERTCERLVQSAMTGVNGTVFAYGQTNSGKTYTMKGVPEEPGIIPLALFDVFDHIAQTADREFLLRVSYLEIYNEMVNDLLSPGSRNLRVHEDPRRGVFVGGLKEHIITSVEHALHLLAAGEAHRHVSSTSQNLVSSRSHTIFTLIIESRPVTSAPSADAAMQSPQTPKTGGSGVVNVSCLNLIDLAGSERSNEDEDRRREGGFINKSLLTLGTVVSRLSENKG
jgi:centromeric protein E